MTWFEYLAELLSRDVDMPLVERLLELTPTERLEKLEARKPRAAAAREPGRPR